MTEVNAIKKPFFTFFYFFLIKMTKKAEQPTDKRECRLNFF